MSDQNDKPIEVSHLLHLVRETVDNTTPVASDISQPGDIYTFPQREGEKERLEGNHSTGEGGIPSLLSGTFRGGSAQVGRERNIPKARMTVVGTVFHQLPNERPFALPTKYEEKIESDETPYSRKMKLGTEWKPIDTGWFATPSVINTDTHESPTSEREEIKCSLLCLSHDPVIRQVIPTSEEVEEESRIYVELGLISLDGSYITEFSSLRRGRDLRIPLPNLRDLRIRATSPGAKVTVTLFPR
jgi:hypothetical protein